MAESRKEYIESLNRMRNSYQNQGYVSINPQNDDGNVGNELSSFAYMNTPPAQVPEQAGDIDLNDRNWWQRTVDTVHSGVSNVTEGVTNFIDDIGDFVMTVGSWFSGLFSGIGSAVSGGSFEEGWEGGTAWLKDATSFEWEHYLNQFWNQADVGHAILSGDLFTGEWGQRWADMGNAEQNKANLAQVHENSWASEWGEFGQGIQTVEQGIGYILPSLVAAYFTGGSSLAAQAATLGTQAAIAGASAMGAGVEKGFKEGATYGEAMGYGATKGAISAGTTAVFMGIGGHVASKAGSGVIGKLSGTVGDKVLAATGSKGATVFASKAVEIASRAGISYASSFANQAVEPFIQSIYDNGNAIAEAYGDNEKIKKYLERCATNATSSAITTAIVSAGREVVDFASRGKDGYYADFFSKRAYQAQKHIERELKSINSDLMNGKITESQAEARLYKLDKYNATVERYGQMALEHAQKVYDQASVVDEKTGVYTKPGMGDLGKNADALKRVFATQYSKSQTDTIQAMAKAFMLHSYSDNRLTFNSETGDFGGSFDSAGKGNLQIIRGGQTYELPSLIDEKTGVMTLRPEKDGVGSAIEAIGKLGTDTKSVIEIPSKSISIGNYGLANKPFTISAEVAKTILAKNEVVSFLDDGLSLTKPSSSYVLAQAGEGSNMAVIPWNDDGNQKYAIVSFDSKTNEITNIAIKSEKPSSVRFSIVPKLDSDKLQATTFRDKTTNEPLAVIETKDGLKIDTTGEISLYAKKTVWQEDLHADALIRKFNIDPSLRKTVELKIASQNGRDLLAFLSKSAGLSSIDEAANKLGGLFISRDGYVYGKNLESRALSLKGEQHGVEEAGRGEESTLNGGTKRRMLTKDDRRSYAEEIKGSPSIGRGNLVIVPEEGEGSGKSQEVSFSVIPESLYTDSMTAIANKGIAGFGTYANTVFALANGNPNLEGVEGIASPNDNEIYIFVDNVETTLEIAALHEYIHLAKSSEEYADIYAEAEVYVKNRLKLARQRIDGNSNELTSFDRSLVSWYDDFLVGQRRLNEELALEELTCDFISKRITSTPKLFNTFPEDDDSFIGEILSKMEERTGFDRVSYRKDSEGNRLTEAQEALFKKGKFNDSEHRILVLYSGSDFDYDEFDMSQIGKGAGSALGWAIYLSDDPDMARNYGTTGARKYYAFPSKILSSSRVTMTEKEVNALVGALSKAIGIDVIKEAHGSDKYGFAECEGDFYGLKKPADLLSAAKNDMSVVNFLENVLQKSIEPQEFLRILCETTGYEGFRKGNQFGVFKPELVKSVYNLSPSESKNVRFAKAPAKSEPEKVISETQKKSSSVLIEEAADSTKPTVTRLSTVRQAFIMAIGETLPSGTEFRIQAPDYKAVHAEINLAKPKDRDMVISNIAKYLGNTEVWFPIEPKKKGGDVSFEKARLYEIMTPAQAEEATRIVMDVLDGKAEPSKLAKWAESLSLSKMTNQQNVRNSKLLSRIQRRVESSLKNAFGYGDVPTAEINSIASIIKDVKPFLTPKSAIQLADNALLQYTDENLGELYSSLGMSLNPVVRLLAQAVKDGAKPGKPLDPVVYMMTNDLLQLIDEDMKWISRDSHDRKVALAIDNVRTMQSVFYGKSGSGKAPILVQKAVEALKRVDISIISPAFFFRSVLGEDAPITVHVNQGLSEVENAIIAKTDELTKLVFEELAGDLDVDAALSKEIEFKGEKITLGVALNRLNLYKTLGEKFFNAKGATTLPDSRRGEVIYTKDDIEDLEALIPSEILEYNDKVLHELTSGKLHKYVAEGYKKATNTELISIGDESNGIYYWRVSRRSDKNFGAKVRGSARNVDLSVYNERVPNSRADLNFDIDFVSAMKNYISSTVRDFETYEWVQTFNVMMNQRVYGTTLNKLGEEYVVGWDEMADLIYHQVLGIPYDDYKSLLGKVGGGALGLLQRSMVLGPQTALRTMSSRPWFAAYFGEEISVKGAIQEVKNGSELALKRNREIIEKYSPYLKNRFASGEIIDAQTSQRIHGKISQFFGTPLRLADMELHLTYGFACAQAKAEAEGHGKPYSDENNEWAVKYLEEASKETQPTNALGRVGGFRFGQYGPMVRQTFGMFASMMQSFYQGVRNAVGDLLFAHAKTKRIEAAIKHHEERIAFYSEEADKAREDMASAMDEETYKDAKKRFEEAEWKKKEHEESKATAEETLKSHKRNHTGKAARNRVIGVFSGLLFSAAMYTAINEVIKRLEGKKEWDEWNAQGLMSETLEQAFFKSFPYLSTIYYSIKNDSDMTPFTIDNINQLMSDAKNLFEAIQKGDGGMIAGSAFNSLRNIAQFFGIPANSLWKLINGTWYNIDRASNLEANGWLGNISATKLRTNFKNAAEAGSFGKAKANLEVWSKLYSAPVEGELLSEIYRLERAGYSSVPSACASTYTDDAGERVQFTTAQANAYQNTYMQLSKAANELIGLTDYKKADDKAKSAMLGKVYSLYSEASKAKALKVAPDSKMGKLLYYCGGNVDLAKYIAGLQAISNVTESRNKTRKENVIAAINRMRGFSKAEKLLLAYLAGYSVNGTSKTTITKYLRTKGYDAKALKEI